MGYNPVRCRIPELLSRIGKTQSWLAANTGYSEQEISDIVRMRDNRVVSLRKGRKLARSLKCYIDDLYVWE